MKNVKLYQTTEEFLKDTATRRLFPHILYDKESGKLLGERAGNNIVAFTITDNPELITVARNNEWIASSATAMTKGECINVLTFDNADFSGLVTFDELKYFLSIGEIPEGCFSGLTTLQTITFTNNIDKIGNNAFEGCTSLSSITIPETLTEIGDSALYGCTGLTHIICLSETPATIGSSTFDETNNCDILVPSDSAQTLYSTTEKWKNYKNRIKVNRSNIR